MKIFALPIIAAALSLSVSACSQTTSQPSEAAPKLTAASEPLPAAGQERIGNWLVVKKDSHIKFTASQEGKSFTGGFESYDVIINFKEDAIETANVTANIDVGSISAGDKDRDGALPGKEWFNVKSFPEAVFESDDFIKTGNNTYEARGTLTMKDNSQPLTLPFTLDITGSKAEMAGSVTLDRTLWEVGTGAWATDEWVSTDVTVDIKISAETPN
ncbi:MAG: YceI family protein [Hellea sp.]